MRRSALWAAALAAGALTAGAAQAEMKIYPYGGHTPNYCPAGLQPVVVGGVICCGKPNTGMSYQQVMAHPAPKKVKKRHYSARAHCPEGTKGCS